MPYLPNALSIFESKSRLSDQDKIFRKMILALNGLPITDQQKDFVLHFIMQAYLLDPANKGLFGYSKSFQEIRALAGDISWDQDFLQQYNEFFTSTNNLNFALLFSAREIADHYFSQKMHGRHASPESKNLVMRIREAELGIDNDEQKGNLIKQINNFFSSRDKGALVKWLKPYWITHARMENNLCISTESLHIRNKVPGLIETIDKNFESASKPPEQTKSLDYVTTGQKSYRFVVSGIDIFSDTLLTQLGTDQSQNKIEILDIGTGSGEFIFNINDVTQNVIEGYGITAREYRSLDMQQNDKHYIFGNAEYLTKIFPDKKFDYIFSRYTFCHLTDPAAALIQAFDRLKVGGVIIIDSIRFPGLNGHLQNMIERLQANGYLISGNAWDDKIFNLVIQKTADHQTLELPMQYSTVLQSKANYRYVGGGLDDYSKLYQKGSERIATIITESTMKNPNIMTLVQGYNLNDVFQADEYQKLSSEEQYIVLLGIVAQQINYDDYLFLLNQTNIPPNILSDINESNDFSAIFRLFGQIQFKAMDKGTQNQVLVIAAVKDLMRLAQQETDKTILKKMGLPIEFHPIGYNESNQKFDTQLVREDTPEKTLSLK